MNKKQKVIVVLGMLVIVGMCLYLPQLERRGGEVRNFSSFDSRRGGVAEAAAAEPVYWEFAEYGWFWATGRQIDLGRLGVQAFVALVVSIALVLLFGDPHYRKGKR